MARTKIVLQLRKNTKIELTAGKHGEVFGTIELHHKVNPVNRVLLYFELPECIGIARVRK